MDDARLLERLQDVVSRLGIEVHSVRGETPSGLCRVGQRQVLMCNTTLSRRQQVSLLCRELSRLDLSRIYIVPEVRQRIEGRSSSVSRHPSFAG